MGVLKSFHARTGRLRFDQTRLKKDRPSYLFCKLITDQQIYIPNYRGSQRCHVKRQRDGTSFESKRFQSICSGSKIRSL